MQARKWQVVAVVIGAVVIAAIVELRSRININSWFIGAQRMQFQNLAEGLRLFAVAFGDYPASDALDGTGQAYAGAMKLCEALVGQDSLGVHRNSAFRADGLDPNTLTCLYRENPSTDNLKARRGPFLQRQFVAAHKLVDIYGHGATDPFGEDVSVLCDTYNHRNSTGTIAGMPILYYRASTRSSAYNPADPNFPAAIYDVQDNHSLVRLGVPWSTTIKEHPMASDPTSFYRRLKEFRRALWGNSFVLLSAGRDGLYGSPDDEYYFSTY